MKKWLLVAGVVAVVMLGVVVFALPALGQAPTNPPAQNQPNGQGTGFQGGCFGAGAGVGFNGMMGGYGYGMMGLNNQVTLKRVADTLGLTADQLSADLQQGQTLAQIAQAQNVSSDTVVASILAPANDMAQIAIKYGYLTQAQAQTMLDNAKQWVGQMMTQQLGSPEGTLNGTPAAPNGVNGGTGYGYGPGSMMGGYFQSSPNSGSNVAPNVGSGFGPGGMMGGSFGGRGMMGF